MFTIRLQVENRPVTAEWKDPSVTGVFKLGSRAHRRMTAAVLAAAFLLILAAPSLGASSVQSAKPASPGNNASSSGNGSGKSSSTRSSTTMSATGVVQSIRVSAFAVKQLDGTTVNVPFDKKTQLFVDGRHVRMTGVKPGYVLVHAIWKAGTDATVLRFVRPN